jgi:HSP20 family protein
MLNTLFTNDVRQTLDTFRRSVDQMFENFYGYQGQPTTGSGAPSERNWTFSPAIESAWNDEYLNLRAILPGVDEKDVNVSVQNNQLVLTGERRAPEGFHKNAYTQMNYGKFHAALTLPSGLNLENVNCTLHHGVLDIRIPVAETSKPKQIRIQTGATEQRAIGA